MSQVGNWIWSDDLEDWVKLRGTAAGAMSIHAIVEELGDIEDVNLAGIAADDIIYWNSVAGEWQPIAMWTAAHKDTHDPEDGADPLDTAVPVKVGAANAIGTSHSLARADHVHEREHAIYTDAAAKAAAVQAGAITNGVTKAPTHDAVYDVKVTADAAQPAATDAAAAVTAVEAAGLALASGKNIKLISALTSDHSWSGITAVMTAGAALDLPNACYVGSDSKLELADADAAASMPVMCLATAAIAENAEGEVLLHGFMRDDTWTWTIGGLIYASVTPGGLSQTAPVGVGDQVQVVGIAITADIILFNPSYELVEISA